MMQMHELSVISQVVESVNLELKGKPVIKVKSVRLEIGELTMLGREQLRFAWGILTGEGPLKGSRLIIVKKPAVIECAGCGYRGGAKHPTGLGSHLLVPCIACPKCGGEVRVVGGRECVLKSMRAVVKEGKKGAGRKGEKGRRRAQGARGKKEGAGRKGEKGRRRAQGARGKKEGAGRTRRTSVPSSHGPFRPGGPQTTFGRLRLSERRSLAVRPPSEAQGARGKKGSTGRPRRARH